MPFVILVGAIAFFAIRGLRRRQRGEIVDAAEVGAVGWVRGTNWRVVAPLSRAENRALLRHPAFLAGAALTPLMLWAAMGTDQRWWHRSPSIALALVPLGWLTIVATNLLTLRSRRAGADELLAAAPTPQPVRTNAFLSTAVVAVAVASVFAVAAVVYSDATVDNAIGTPRLSELAAGVLVVAGSVTVGVAVARWLPHLGFGVIAVFAVTFLQTPVADPASPVWDAPDAHPARWLGFLAGPLSEGVPELEVRPSGWHLVYLAGLIVLMVGVALARDGFAVQVRVILATAIVLAVGAGWAQTRPPTEAQVASMTSYLTEPREHQTCTSDALTTYCAYREQRDRMDDWAERVASVRALLPAEVARRDLEVTARVPTRISTPACSPQPFSKALHPEVAQRVDPEEIWPDDGQVHPGTNRFPCGGREVGEFFTAMQIGSWAVGLPPNPPGSDVRCSAAGQARAVVALWLGATGIDSAERTLRDVLDEHGRGPITFASWSDPPMLGAVFHAEDLLLALALLDLPTDEVRSVVQAEWPTWTEASTPSSAIAEAFGLEVRGAAQDSSAKACR